MKLSRALLLALPLAAASASAQTAVNLATWNFDDQNATKDSGSATATFLPISSGTTTYTSGNPAAGWSSTQSAFPAQGTNSGTAGVRANVSTVGLSQASYDRIRVNFDLRFSGTASRFFQVQYTTNGSAWTNLGAVQDYGTTSAVWKTYRSTSYAADATSFVVNDPLAYGNANFGVRVVTVFSPTLGNAYAPVSGSYGTGGTFRIDNLGVEAVPEPASMAVLGLGLAAFRRRRARK